MTPPPGRVGPLGGLHIERSSITDRVAAALRASLFDGRLRPGTPLREAELAASFDVSRGTVREALRVLVAENLLTRLPNKGVAVRVLHADDVEDLYRARLVLESGAVAAARPDGLEALRRALGAYEAAVAAGEPAQVNETHIGFHTAVVSLAGSARLSALGQALLADLRLVLAAAEREIGDAAEQLVRHRRLFDLIAAGETSAAQAEIEAHLGGAAGPLVEALARGS
jgi:DNA-binding GntR family transcriptional regulator